MADIDDALAIVRLGGDRGSQVFVRMAKEFYLKTGTSGLASWVHEAFRELPQAEQEALVCVGLEAMIREMTGQTKRETPH
ncbi:hypothetical protein [Bradyrhizobium sp. UNPF46]|uniref:hypothetical protein n=1 Tax=Bradyrhizobium sp. UNPF46 TaxID=1141168 RepID=UPI001152EBEF|nr:hypothetical protein [Bradyrhizobium sp. UNPF46]